MCAILVTLGLAGEFQEQLATMSHRGPDATASVRVNDMWMGHNRLSVVGVDNGAQPLHNEDNTVWAVVNGEFYGLNKLPGHRYSTNSDSEHLVHLYEKFGCACVDHLNGEFAFVLYDSRKRLLLAGRDRFGVRPLYYARCQQGWVFASEAKAILQIAPADVDQAALDCFLQIGYLPPGTSLFAGISMLPPAHLLTLEGDNCKIDSYWSPVWGEAGSSETFMQTLAASVSRRIPAEVPFCCHLSGGMDSGLVTALAAKESGKAPVCYTVAFDGKDYRETEDAQAAADFIGAELRVVDAPAKDLLAAFPPAVIAAEGPANNLHIGAKWLLGQRISSDGIKVALTGEGSDELFLGYEHLRADGGVVTAPLPSVAGIHSHGKPDVGVPTWVHAKRAVGVTVSGLLKNPGVLTGEPLMEVNPDITFPKAAAWLWMNYALPDYILRRLDDAQGMAHAVESRLPFLDADVAKAAMSCDTRLLLGTGELEKSPLRTAAVGLLPPRILQQRKRPFQAPPVAIPEGEILEAPLYNLFNRRAVELFLSTQPESPSKAAVSCTLWSLGILSRHYRLSL